MSIIPLEPNNLVERAIKIYYANFVKKYGEISEILNHPYKNSSTIALCIKGDNQKYPVILNEYLEADRRLRTIFTNILLDANDLLMINKQKIQPVVVCDSETSELIKVNKLVNNLNDIFINLNLNILYQAEIFPVDNYTLLKDGVLTENMTRKEKKQHNVMNKKIRRELILNRKVKNQKEMMELIKTTAETGIFTKKELFELVEVETSIDWLDFKKLFEYLYYEGELILKGNEKYTTVK